MSEQATQPTSIDEILGAIEINKRSNTHDIWCPSLGKAIPFFPLNAAHQKEFVRSIVDGPFMSTYFNITTYNVIRTVIADPTVNPDTLTTLDKKLILLGLRAHNIGSSYEADHVTTDGKEFTYDVKLLPLLKKKSKSKQAKDETVKDGEYTVVVGYPTLAIENQFESYIYNQVQNLDGENKQGIKNSITLMFISNVFQFVRTLTIGDRVVNFDSLPITHKLQIANTLPSTVVQKVISLIDKKFGPPLETISKYNFQKDGVDYEGDFDVDNTFFLQD